MKWTEKQRQAIETRNSNILMAAAAGSGKTAVLVERIKRLILEDGVPIDRMLVVTFTNAAASEMKEKIRNAIYKEIDENPENGPALREQLNLLGRANISLPFLCPGGDKDLLLQQGHRAELRHLRRLTEDYSQGRGYGQSYGGLLRGRHG